MTKRKQTYQVGYDHIDGSRILFHSKHRSLRAAFSSAQKLLSATKWRKARATRAYIKDLKSGKLWKVAPNV